MRIVVAVLTIAAVLAEVLWLAIVPAFYLIVGCPTCNVGAFVLSVSLFPLWVLVEIPLAIVALIAMSHVAWRSTTQWRSRLTQSRFWRWFWNET